MTDMPKTARVLLVDDDQELGHMLSDFLAADRLHVTVCNTGEDGVETFSADDFDLLILDIMLPGMSGLDVLKKIRQRSQVPIIMLTARGDDIDRIIGLEFGADDYLPKPFEMDELLARLRAVIRRSAGHAAPVIVIGEVVVDPKQMRVTVGGVPKSLSPQEYRLLLYLMLHASRVVPQQELAEQLHGTYEERESNAVEVLVGRVRRKLGIDLIETRRGFGYLIEAGEQ